MPPPTAANRRHAVNRRCTTWCTLSISRVRDNPGEGSGVLGEKDGLAEAQLFNQRTELIFGDGY